MSKRTFTLLGLAALSSLLAGCGGGGPGAGAPSLTTPVTRQVNGYQDFGYTVPPSSVENPFDAGQFMHTEFVISNRPTSRLTPSSPSGYSPAQIRSAYGLPSTGGSGTIVIVDAYDDRNALSDFNGFANQFGLPVETSSSVTSSSNKVFQVVYANGNKPKYNSGWSQEEDLDIEWAHAMAPSAKVVLVEAGSNSNTNLYKADNVAATISGARECSNSWGGGETSGETSIDSTFNHPGVVYFFANGDVGGQRDYPAASVNVVACGGTSLLLNGNGTRSSETVWSATGCGLSAYEPTPSWQSGVTGVVGMSRGIGDISADSDPNTGVSVLWSGNWYVYGGTSVATPMLAGITNLSGSNRGSAAAQNAKFYSEIGSSNFFDVTSGSAGKNSALPGYDLPTGVGTPNGAGGF